jgi:copper chaperone
MTQTTDQLNYTVPGMNCGHCRASITADVEKVAGVASVSVNLDTKRVTVAGEQLDDAAVRAAIDEAGYDVAPRDLPVRIHAV